MSGRAKLPCALTFFLVVLLSSCAFAGNTSAATVTYQVSAINEFAVSGSPPPLTITTAVAGSEPLPVSDASTSYSFSTNQDSRKVTAALSANMPAGVTLETSLAAAAAPNAWTSLGYKTLSTTAEDVATGPRKRASGLVITYRLSATVDAGTPSGTVTVTYTLTNQ